jgi:hypothetical protein
MSRDVSHRDADDPHRDVSSLENRPATRDSRSADRVRADALPPRPDRAGRPTQENRREVPFTPGRTVLYDRDRGYQLSETEIRTLAELGKFRVIATHDLTRKVYAPKQDDADRDLRSLIRQGLVRKGTFNGPELTPRELLTLTRRGHRLLRSSRVLPDDQAIYHGFVKPREANHDADLYLLYQKEAARIEGEGGKNLRVVLDYELKRKINRDIARFGTTARKEIAERHGLRVVRNKIPIPDMRIECETREGDMNRVNLELVTEHYRGRQVAEKVRAGFSLYTPHGEADHLRRVLDQHELTAEILSL